VTGPAPQGLLLMAHGTPSRPEELAAFYTEIRRGSPPPADLLAELADRYRAIGGLSPLAARSEAQRAGVAAALEQIEPGRWVVALGTKFADPRIAEAVDALVAAGCRRAVGVVLAPHSSIVSVGDYRRRAEEAASGQLDLRVVDRWHLAPGLAAALAERVRAAIARLPPAAGPPVVVCTAHSVPQRVVDAGDDYPAQVQATAEAVLAELGVPLVAGPPAPGDAGRGGRSGRGAVAGEAVGMVAFQSAGRTADPWVGPDLLDTIRRWAAAAARAVVVCPVGFVSDHLEVLYDLDVEARQVAESAGVAFARTESFNDDPVFCEVVARVARASLAVDQ
jgi:ferrochelatase